ncbi:hypothetical protein KEM56_004227 [Ascosphaera pollenicola]|nr:hypothetical protein KEM56_004227 [Ascosphaera pollenicola]
MAMPPKVYQFLVSVFAAMGSFLYGYDLGVMAEIIASPDYLEKFNPDSDEAGLVVSMFTTGAFCGAAFGGPSGDYLGRRATILLGAVIFIIGGAVQTAASNIHFLWGGRFVAGLGVGFLTMVIPLYQAELAHPSIRGRVTALQQFMLGIGALFASWIGYACFVRMDDDDHLQWRLPLALQLVPAGILALLIMLFPESPRWLIDHDREDRGLEILAKLHAHGDTNDEWVQEEYHRIKAAIQYEHEHEASFYSELFTNKSCFRRLFLACSLQGAIQMTGVSSIQYYSVTIYGMMGFTTSETLKYQGVNSIIAIIGQAVCVAFIDHTGRRWVLINGNLANCACFVIATAMLGAFPPETNDNRAAQWAFIAVTWLYNFCFSAFCGPLSWIIPAEIFDTRTRSKGCSISTMTSFAFNTMIGQVSPKAMDKIGYKFYILFIVCNLTNAVFFWYLMPETANVPMEDMNYMFENAPWFIPSINRKDYIRPITDIESSLKGEEFKNPTIIQHEHQETAH